MTTPLNDEQAWGLFPAFHHTAFNKLWVAEQSGNICGPAGTAIPEEGEYIVRPIFNLDGMGRGVSKKYFNAGNYKDVPPGYFWTKFLYGTHYSVDYRNTGYNTQQTTWVADLCVTGESTEVGKFSAWNKISVPFALSTVPHFIDNLQIDAEYINIEYIDDMPIDVHLRRNYDFVGHNFNTLHVVWDSTKHTMTNYPDDTWTFIPSVDVTDTDKRLGFYGRI